MPIAIDITDQTAFAALVGFLASIVPTGTPIIQAQDNSVPMPIGGFVLMNNTGLQRLATNIDMTDKTTQVESVLAQYQYTIQLDFLGPDSQQWAMMASALFRDGYATAMFPANIQPLYADDPMQIPLMDGENQYEQRWKLTATLQYNPTMTTMQQSATAVSIGLAPIDQTFAP